jgi:hypothetical protein
MAIEQGHEPIVHVRLHVAVKQRQAQAIGGEVNLHLLIAAEHHDVFEEAGRGSTGDFRQFEDVAM